MRSDGMRSDDGRGNASLYVLTTADSYSSNFDSIFNLKYISLLGGAGSQGPADR